MVEYKHGLSKSLMRCLVKLCDAGGGPLNISDDITLTKSQYTNVAKLAYWSITEKANPHGGERGGVWKVTRIGWQFIRGEISLPKWVRVYRGDVVKKSARGIYFDEVTGGWKYKPQYAREAIAHKDPGQGSLI